MLVGVGFDIISGEVVNTGNIYLMGDELLNGDLRAQLSGFIMCRLIDWNRWGQYDLAESASIFGTICDARESAYMVPRFTDNHWAQINVHVNVHIVHFR